MYPCVSTLTSKKRAPKGALTRTTADIAFESKRYFPSFAIGSQEGRGKVSITGSQRLRIAAERPLDLLDCRRERPLIHRHKLPGAHTRSPADQDRFDRASAL